MKRSFTGGMGGAHATAGEGKRRERERVVREKRREGGDVDREGAALPNEK